MHNPPAFPFTMPDDGGESGMTLRDWFAGQALAGAGQWCPLDDDGYTIPLAERPAKQAAHYYALADAMLAARLSAIQEGGRQNG